MNPRAKLPACLTRDIDVGSGVLTLTWNGFCKIALPNENSEITMNLVTYLAKMEQLASGIHLRLRSRAFIVAASKDNRVVFVNLDACMASQIVTIKVIERLKASYGDLYIENNVAISATHTHSGLVGLSSIFCVYYNILWICASVLCAYTRKIIESSKSNCIHHVLLLTGHSADLSLKGSPYWMAPELMQAVIHKDNNSDLAFAIDTGSQVCNLAWSKNVNELVRVRGLPILIVDRGQIVKAMISRTLHKSLLVDQGSSEMHLHFSIFISTFVLVAAILSVLATLAVTAAICFYCHRRRKNGSQPNNKEFSVKFRYFTPEELKHATDQFAEGNHLAYGGTAAVYKGILQREGRPVAVKRLEDYQPDIDLRFKTEVERLTELNHPNIVALYGCTRPLEKPCMLVYEYVENKDLEHHLRIARIFHLPWNIRMNIAVEIASALKYIHALDIIHRDIKPSNILLNKDMHAKVGDFGFARHVPNDQIYIKTNHVRGTPGYEDPEYIRTYQFSKKSDVYSFGVVLIQLISSLEAIDLKRGNDCNLILMAMEMIQNNALDKLVDVRCLEKSSKDRPSMDEVFKRLEEIQSAGDPDPFSRSSDSNSVSYCSAQNVSV
ncbi:ceramidase [Trifolium repens]|nr:ceramidase [Trifolium repens]